MRVFTTVWLGQMISAFGSNLTAFAIGVWVYKRTESATLFSLLSLIVMLPGLLISPLAGAIVDRWDRRKVMIMSDAGASLGTLAVALLLYFDCLAVWHVVIAVTVISVFGTFQWPAFSAATTLLVPKEHLGRASGMTQLGQAAATIFAPLAAGLLYEVIHLYGIVAVDYATFLFSVVTLLFVHFPRPEASDEGKEAKGSIWREALYGWGYIKARPGLLGLLLFFAVINFSSGMGNVMLGPLVLSFAGTAQLGTIITVLGFGMLGGSLAMSAWGGPKRRIHGILLFGMVQGLALMVGGMSASALVVGAAGFLLAFVTPVITGSSQVIWQTKTPPDVQGRVFATRSMFGQLSIPLAYLLAGPLADKVFQPLLNGPLSGNVGAFIGTGQGRGIGLLFIFAGCLPLLAGLAAYASTRVRRVEDELPDYVAEEKKTPAAEPEAAPVLAAEEVAVGA
ncbi:MAG: MFS transporter [Acidobacteria bacterium]|nr:MFS transporter [Acidobacteriota bacterium]